MDFIINFFTTNTGEIELKKIIISVVLAILAAVVSIVTSLFTAFANNNRIKKTTYINTITSNRIKWMQDLKGLIDVFICKTQIGYFSPVYNDIKDKIKYFEELSSIRNKIFLHLNYKGYIDDKIMTTVNEIYTRIELIYEIDTLFKINDVSEKMKYLFKYYHTDIFKQLLEQADISSSNREEIIEAFKNSDEIPEVLRNAINKEITKFNERFKKAPRRIAKEVQDFHNELVMLNQIYLKLEWNRVKDESNSKLKSCNEEKYKAIADEMISNYNLKLYDYEHDKLPDYLR